MDRSKIEVRRNEDELLVSGLEGLGRENGEWSAVSFGGGKLLLSQGQVPRGGGDPGTKAGFGWLAIDMFARILSGLMEQKWSGALSVDAQFGTKQIYLVHGELVFAGSDVVDDRLGEVIYRNGDLSLDELTNTTAQVCRGVKFGQVLITSELFDSCKLWRALKKQVVQILRSIFMEPFVSLEIHSGRLPSFEVRYNRSSMELLQECQGFGAMYQGFVSRLDGQSSLRIVDEASAFACYSEDTFLGGMLRLINDSENIAALVSASQVHKHYTLAALLRLCNERCVEVLGLKPFNAHRNPSLLLSLKRKINIYEFLLTELAKNFANEGERFPQKELEGLIDQIDFGEISPVFFDDDGFLHSESLNHIYNQCSAVPARMPFFESVIDSLTRFSLQISLDLLVAERGAEMKKLYRKLIFE